MGFLDKLKFWKKEEEFELPEPVAPGMGDSGMLEQRPGFPAQEQPPGFGGAPFDQSPGFPPAEPQVPPAQTFGQQQPDQQMQLLNSKLDTIKAQLETVLQRLERMEKESSYQKRWGNV